MIRTKIICTAGPSVASLSQIEALVAAGMSILRINCSHGDHAQYLDVVTKVREVEKKLKTAIGIMIDLQGPKLRVGDLPEPFQLSPDEIWQLSPILTGSQLHKIIPIKIKNFAQSVAVGGKVFMDDGLIEVKVIKKKGQSVFVQVIHGGTLQSRKGMNIPFYKGKLSAITSKDRADLIWGLRQGIDLVALSFVREAKDILALRRIIAEHGPKKIKPLVFAKIEKPESVDNLAHIIKESDGVLVARGDLGIELQQEKVPVVQKYIIELCRRYKKPNIVATQMLDSMRINPIPTRAEVSDVASAIFAGCDAVLLTGETSSGKYPIEACATMKRIIKEVEDHLIQRRVYRSPLDFELKEYFDIFLFHANQMAEKMDVKAVIMLTKEGRLIKAASKFHPKQPIYALAPTLELARKLTIYWGIFPINISSKMVRSLIKQGMSFLEGRKMIKKGDRVLFIYRDYQTDNLNLKIVVK